MTAILLDSRLKVALYNEGLPVGRKMKLGDNVQIGYVPAEDPGDDDQKSGQPQQTGPSNQG